MGNNTTEEIFGSFFWNIELLTANEIDAYEHLFSPQLVGADFAKYVSQLLEAASVPLIGCIFDLCCYFESWDRFGMENPFLDVDHLLRTIAIRECDNTLVPIRGERFEGAIFASSLGVLGLFHSEGDWKFLIRFLDNGFHPEVLYAAMSTLASLALENIPDQVLEKVTSLLNSPTVPTNVKTAILRVFSTGIPDNRAFQIVSQALASQSEFLKGRICQFVLSLNIQNHKDFLETYFLKWNKWRKADLSQKEFCKQYLDQYGLPY